MPIAHSSLISFGLVAIPISMYTATQDNNIHLNQLHKDDQGRVKYKKVCSGCGKELDDNDITRGYQFSKGRYVEISKEDIEKSKSAKEKAITILCFVKLDEISPVYFDRTYQAMPEPGGEKAFELLRVALLDEQKIGIGKSVLGTRDTLIAIIPRNDCMLVSTMFFEAEIRSPQKSYPRMQPQEEELTTMRQLMNVMDKPFEPLAYKNEYQEKMRELVEAKIAGKEIVAAKPANVVPVIDLLAALKKSVESAEKTKELVTV